MTLALTIGLSLGFISILFSCFLKQIDEKTFYGLLLASIGALYVGFSWSDTASFLINCIQWSLFATL
ncbi:MAG: hypothetical protein JO072_06085, partial [Parafilimonas sp.]|nr:hypothetical protein [Parafilimonas sp.]